MTNDKNLAVIEQIIERVRPTIQMDGGDIEFVKYENDTVFVRLHGACVTCPISMYTLKMGIEEALREQIPNLVEVIQVP